MNWLHFIFVCICISGISLDGSGRTTHDDPWTEDVGKAFEIAQSEHRDILMLFTGSDWCPACIKLEKEILSKAEFQAAAAGKLVLLKLDFPRSSDQDPVIAEQNKKWAKEFGVNAFPTLFLLDENGRPFSIMGYEDVGVDHYLDRVEKNRRVRVARDEKMAEAQKATGLDRARLLDEAISQMHISIVELYYPEIVQEIIELDQSDVLGLRTKWNSVEESEMRKSILADIMIVARLEKPATAIQFIDEVLTEVEFPIQQKLEILNVKLGLTRQLNEPEKVDHLMREMIAMDGLTEESRERLLVKMIVLMVGSNRFEQASALLSASLKEAPKSVYLLKAQGDLLESRNELAEAINAYEAAIAAAQNSPDLLIELTSAKADAQYELKQEAESLQTLDQFIDNERQPADLRAQALLHKSLLMRTSSRIRQARLAENRAVEIVQSPQQKREVQKLVEALRAKFGE